MFRFAILVFVAASTSAWRTPSADPQSCEQIRVPLCLGNGTKYSKTLLPNFIGHTEQSQINLFTKQKELVDLIKTKCSDDLVFFVCATLLPICVDPYDRSQGKKKNQVKKRWIPPCKNLCLKVYNDCISSVNKLNFQWPKGLSCSGLPEHATGMCVKPGVIVPVVKSKKSEKKLVKATCDSKARRKYYKLKARDLRRYDHVFKAKVTSLNHAKTRIKFAVYRFFKRSHLSHFKSLSVNLKDSCKNLFNEKKTYLVFANTNKNKNAKDVNIKISVVVEWKNSYYRALRRYARNISRHGSKG